MRITSKAHIAVLLFQQLGRAEGKLLSIREVSTKQNVSLHYLEQIISKFKRVNPKLLLAKKGPNGGLSLGLKPHEISLFDIYEACDEGFNFQTSIPENFTPIIEDDDHSTRGEFGETEKDSVEKAKLKTVMSMLEQQTIMSFKNITLSSLL